MCFQNAENVRSLISAAAESGTPFLFAVDYELGEGMYVEAPAKQGRVLYAVPQSSNKPPFSLRTAGPGAALGTGTCGPRAKPCSSTILPSPMSPAEYKSKFDTVQQAILRGETHLANLTVRTPIQCEIGLEEIFQRATAPFKLLVPGRFVCFSPERFVKIARDGIISTNPMKGTIDASVPDAQTVILEDVKELEEHQASVDLLKNELGVWAKSVTVERFRYIDRIQAGNRELLQVSSLITGTLPSDWRANLGRILFDMLPVGSCTGVPKQSTIQVLQAAEGEPRGYYTGVFGYFDGEELDSAVMIRFIEEQDGLLYFRSGGGITARSDWQREYQETLQKIYLPFSKRLGIRG